MARKKILSVKTAPKKMAVKKKKRVSETPKAKPKTKRRTIRKEATISSSNVKERVSRPNFELIMTPWVCVPTAGPTDNGHDYNVQIISAKDLEDYRPDGKFFLVQLRSQANLAIKNGQVTPHAVETHKIRQWYNSSSQMPFMFVVNDLKTNKFYCTWIDEEFIAQLEKQSPFWTQQETVSFKIPVSNTITPKYLENIREYVYNYRQVTKKLLEPGVFFEMKEKVVQSINIYDQLIQDTPYESIKQDVVKLRNDLQNAVYRIAITGLSRVGKSTLINHLIKRPDISPTDVWQTTGVPILIQPGKEEKVIINFLDPAKKPEEFVYSSELIKQYAAREFNEDNHKGVRDVSVFISSTQLERGVMFYDIPGLNDPNDTILDYALYTADCANAILYMIDGSPVASESFVFSNEMKKQIERFSRKDKVFLIINKVDKLTPEELEGLKKEIDRNLDKYNLREKVSPKIYYLSINPKDQSKLNALKGYVSSPEELEKDLWAFMLSENKVGFFKLYALMRELQQSTKKMKDIITAKSLDAKSKLQLSEAMSAVIKKIPDLEKHIHNENTKIKRIMRTNLELRKNKIVEGLEAFLEKSKNMPTDEAIKSFLTTEGHRAVNSTKADVENELGFAKEYIDIWISDNLKQVRDIINLKGNHVDYSLKEIEDINLPAFDFSSTWGTGILAAIAGFIINPVVAGFGIGLGLGGALLDLIFGSERRKQKRINKLTQKARKEYAKTFGVVELDFESAINQQIRVLIGYVNRKLKLYFDDIKKQITEFELDANFNYVEFEKNSSVQLSHINSILGDTWDEIQQYLVVIRPL